MKATIQRLLADCVESAALADGVLDGLQAADMDSIGIARVTLLVGRASALLRRAAYALETTGESDNGQVTR